MDRDTDIGGPAGRFPGTRCSLVEAARSSEPAVREQALETLISAYWKPVYKYLRVRWRLSNEDAKDLTQEFFARALVKGYLERYDSKKARLRTYLRVCVDGFVSNQMQAARRLKRGGAAQVLSLDFDGAEAELHKCSLHNGEDLEEYFHKEWVRHLFGLAVEELRQSCVRSGKQRPFELFRRYDIEGPDAASRPSYASLAEELGLPVTQVTNDLAFARREFRRIVLEQLRAATASDQEFRAEARRILHLRVLASAPPDSASAGVDPASAERMPSLRVSKARRHP